MVLGQSVSLGAVEFGRLRAGLGPAVTVPDAACFAVRAKDVAGGEHWGWRNTQCPHTRKKGFFYVFGGLAGSDSGVRFCNCLVHRAIYSTGLRGKAAAGKERDQQEEAG
ncbi:hypothetical protein GCM10028794_28140 [Silanimonas algicola]